MGRAENRRAWALEVVDILVEAGHEAVWAGGCVRDLLLGRDPDDFDIATDAPPERVREVFGYRRTFAVGESFGVILVRGARGQEPIEVATFRAEGPYLDGRHPESVRFATREEDARRRDFTINGLFMDPRSGEVFDHVGGQADLRRRLVRAIGDPRDRIAEDKLRMLRAIRFAAALGFAMDPATGNAISEHASEIDVVSAERVAGELKKMLLPGSRCAAIDLAIETGLLLAILPEVGDATDDGAGERVRDRIGRLEGEAGPMVALACVLADVPDPTSSCRGLRLSNQETDLVTWLITHRDSLGDARQQPRSRLFPVLADDRSSALLSFVGAVGDAGWNSDVDWCRQALERLEPGELNPRPLITGDDLVSVGLSPGPLFKTLLDSVRNAQLDEVVTDRDQAMALVREIRTRQDEAD